MIFRESAPVVPLLAYALAVALGVNSRSIYVGFLICEAAGIIVYVLELRHRFKDPRRGGRH